LETFNALLTNNIDILPSDIVIIEELRDGGTTLNEDILSRIFKDASNDSQAIYRVASDAGKMFAKEEDYKLTNE
jgi:hypothetical protein